MNTWIEEFDKLDTYDGGGRGKMSTTELKQFIATVLQEEKQKLLRELLNEGQGGGNWRRIINGKFE